MPLGRIGKYELLEPLGQGGMGVVFKARDVELDRVVALKILPADFASDPERRARLMREARAGASLNHSGIAAFYDAGEAPLEPPDLLAPGTPGPFPVRVMYVCMEYVPGADLKSLVTDRPLPIPKVIEIATQIAAGLEAAHAAGVVHRDLKPANIRVTADGHIKIIDFGLARMLLARSTGETSTELTSRGRVLGTAFYMSPEMAEGSVVDARGDLFSLGTIIYELVSGRVPFEGDSFPAVLYNVVNTEPPPLARYAATVPDELQRIVSKLHEKNPARRYHSAQEVRLDLERLARDGSASRGKENYGGRRQLIRVLATVAAILAVGASVLLWKWGCAPLTARSLAVVPFDNRTGEPGLDYLGEGLANSVHGDLVRRSRLNVASFLTVLSLKRPMAAVGVAHELGVATVLEGALRREGSRTLLNVELVDGSRGTVLWADRYDYSVDAAQAIEDRIVRGVTQRMTGRALGGASEPATRSTSAYDLYLQASALLDEPDDPQSPDRALALFEKALALDPSFALAWAGECRARLLIWGQDKSPETLHRAEEAADRAVTLDPQLIEARTARAQVYRVTGRYDDAIKEFVAIQAINPEWDEAWLQLGVTYRDTGDLLKAESSLRRALELRPNNWRAWNSLGNVLLRRADYAGASDAFRQIVRIVPDKNRGYEQLGALAIKTAHFVEAIAQFEKLPRPVESGTTASNIATAYFFARRMQESRRWYQLALDLEPRNLACQMNLGDWYLRYQYPDSARTRYTEASRLLGEILQVNPKDAGAWLDRALCQAKLGDCATAAATLSNISGSLPATNADQAHEIARLEATCGRTERALVALDRALRYGVPPASIRAEDEFRLLADNPRFRELLARTR